MSSAFKILMGSGSAPVTADEDFELVTGLYHFNGTNGGQNSSFSKTAGSVSPTLTAYGQVNQGNFTPWSAGTYDWSVYFDGSSSLEGSNFNVGAAFTVECFFYLTGVPSSASDHAALISETTNTNTGLWSLRVTGGNKLQFEVSGVVTLTGSTTINRGVWYHAAAVREGTSTNQTKLYLNGVLEDTDTCATTFNAGGGATIGMSNDGSSHGFQGYICQSKVNNSASYTSAFTPNWTNSYGGGGGGWGWHCYTWRFRDGAFSNELTVSGTPKIVPFSPFARTTAYSVDTYGGSAHFDGSGDVIVSDTAIAMTGEFSISGWIYPQATGSYSGIIATSSSGQYNTHMNYTLAMHNGNLDIFQSTGTSFYQSTVGTPKLHSWNHFAISKDSSKLYGYLNGTKNLETTNITGVTANGLEFGRFYNSYNGYYYTGYLADLRLVNGSSLYTGSSVSIPSGLSTNVTNTSLLMHFENGNMIDASAKTQGFATGNAQLDTSVKKFGTASAEFDGTGDYMYIPYNYPFSTGDFTIECWVYFKTTTTNQGIFQLDQSPLSGVTYIAPVLFTGGGAYAGRWATMTKYGGNQSLYANSSYNPSTETWYHTAVVRNSGTVKVYIDGVEVISVSDQTDYTDRDSLVIGSFFSSSYDMDGYIDEFRITHKARYTSNFTPPTKEFFDIDINE